MCKCPPPPPKLNSPVRCCIFPLVSIYLSIFYPSSIYLSIYLSSIHLSIDRSIFTGPVRVFFPLGSSDTMRCFRKLIEGVHVLGREAVCWSWPDAQGLRPVWKRRVRARTRVRSGAAPRASRPTLGSSRASGWRRCRCSWQLHGKLKGRFWSL